MRVHDFGVLSPEELAAPAPAECSHAVCAFEGPVPDLSPEAWALLRAERGRLGRMLTGEEVASVLRAQGAEDGHA